MTREEILAVLDEVIREGDDLFDRTNRDVERHVEVTLLQSETMMLGYRALNSLYAIRVLADFHLDDQIATIARTLVEGATDVQYLNESTVRRLRNGDMVPLTTDVKSVLFASHKPAALLQIVEESEEEISADLRARLEAEAAQGVALRERLGIGAGPYWSGASNAAMVRELRTARGAGRQGDLVSFRRLFADFSFYAHANPNDAPYVNKASGMLRATFRDDSIIGAAIIPGLEIFRFWGAVFGLELRPRFIGYFRRLHSADEDDEAAP